MASRLHPEEGGKLGNRTAKRASCPMAHLARISVATLAALALAACGSSSGPRVMARDAGAVDRSIDLSGSDGPLPLTTPDDAGRAAIGAGLFYRSVIDTLQSESGGKSAAKSSSTENCSDGGTRTTDKSGLDRTIRYDQCLEGTLYTDGLFKVEVTSPGYPNSGAKATIGENDVPLLAENRDPANDVRSLLIGTLDGDVRIDSHGDVKEVDAHANMKGAEQDLDGSPRMNYGLDGTHIDVNIDGDDLLIHEDSEFRLTGDCGTGLGNVGTNRNLRVNKNSGVVSDGELALANAAGENATAVFNADESIDVTAPSGAKHYSKEEFRALCPF